MENIYVVIMVLFGFCGGFSFARFNTFRKEKSYGVAAAYLLLAVVCMFVFILAAGQRWM